MKYYAGMTGFHKDIVAALRLMCGNDTIAQSNADEASPAPLRNYLKSKYGNSGKGEPGGAHYFATPSKGVDVNFDGMTVTLSWSQTAKYIRDNTSEIFSEDESADDDIPPDKNSLELLCNTFDESEIKCPFWHTGETMRYLNFGGVDFKCDYCDCSFCEFDKLTDFLASHCHNYEDCPYYCKHKDDKLEFPCDDCGYDVKGCCDYPETPDDYCVCGDKKIPATTQNDTTVTVFDYSELDPDTAAKLENVTAEIFNVRKEYIFTMAKKVAYAHDLLANCGNGKFGAWCESIGISRFTGNNLIKIVELFNNSTLEEQENLNKLSDGNIKLLYEAARPSAPPELVEQVKSGDITTHKEYIALKKELEEANKKLEDAKFHSKQQSESFDRVAEQSSVNYHKYLDEMHKNQDLMKQIRDLNQEAEEAEQEYNAMAEREDQYETKICELNRHIKELEARPVEATFTDNSEELEKKDKEISELKDEIERLSDKKVKVFAIRLTIDEYEKLFGIVKESNDFVLTEAVKKAQIIRL